MFHSTIMMCWANIFKSSSLRIKDYIKHAEICTHLPTTTNHSLLITPAIDIHTFYVLHCRHYIIYLNNSRRNDRDCGLPHPVVHIWTPSQDTMNEERLSSFLERTSSRRTSLKKEPKLVFGSVDVKDVYDGLTPKKGSGRLGRRHPGKPHPRK